MQPLFLFTQDIFLVTTDGGKVDHAASTIAAFSEGENLLQPFFKSTVGECLIFFRLLF